MNKDDEIKDMMASMSCCKFEAETPGAFFECESAVFMKGSDGSLCYTTSVERAELLAAILNEWVELKSLSRRHPRQGVEKRLSV